MPVPARLLHMCRAASSVLALASWAFGGAQAHPLPDTTLTISGGDGRLELAIALPLHELALALPEAASIFANPAGQPLSARQKEILAAYFASHVALAAAGDNGLELNMADARTSDATGEDVGQYRLIEVDLTAAAVAGSATFPLILRYDAVMHEVRNHRATVLLQGGGGETAVAGTVAFDPVLGRAAPLVLVALP